MLTEEIEALEIWPRFVAKVLDQVYGLDPGHPGVGPFSLMVDNYNIPNYARMIDGELRVWEGP